MAISHKADGIDDESEEADLAADPPRWRSRRARARVRLRQTAVRKRERERVRRQWAAPGPGTRAEGMRNAKRREGKR